MSETFSFCDRNSVLKSRSHVHKIEIVFKIIFLIFLKSHVKKISTFFSNEAKSANYDVIGLSFT